MATSDDSTKYEVALSFAGEDRAYVARVAAVLSKAGVRVFYDKYERATLWGKDLFSHLTDVYQKASKYTIIFISEHYAGKVWPTHERRSAQARALEERQEYILPARFDDTEIPGLLPTTGYVDLRTTSSDELASLVLEKLGRTAAAASSPTPDHDAVLALIVKIQSKKQPLAESVAEALALARSSNDSELATFCTNEMVGYAAEVSEKEAASRVHRHMQAYCTLGRIDITSMGFHGMNLTAVVEQHRDQFFEKFFVIGEPIAMIEDKAYVQRNEKGFWHTTRKVSDFNPDADSPDMEVHCYSEPNAYAQVLASVRAELTRRLTALLTRPGAKTS